MLAFVALPVIVHVPTYVGGVENCFTPPRAHTVSQVIYLKGSGGLEVHLNSDTDPFDIRGEEILDVDAVFKEEYDQSTYSLYIGCGGCVATQDPIVIAPVALSGYEVGAVEPFTQTRYYSVFPVAERKYNSNLLANCSENHFTIRIVDYNNRTDDATLVWGAVIGLSEQFTFQELLEFPIFVLRNHGDVWNGFGWTAWTTFLILGPLLLWTVRLLLDARGVPVVWLESRIGFIGSHVHIEGSWAVRELLYELALLAFVGTMLEEFVHLLYAQVGVPVDYALWVGLFGVILAANGIPIFHVVSAWAAIQSERSDRSDRLAPRLCSAAYLRCSASVLWAPIEVVLGFSYLFLFGSGFFVGPAAVMLAGFVRLIECGSTRPLPSAARYECVRTHHPPMLVVAKL